MKTELYKATKKLDKKFAGFLYEHAGRPPFILHEHRANNAAGFELHVFDRTDNKEGDVVQAIKLVADAINASYLLEDYDWYVTAEKLFKELNKIDKQVQVLKDYHDMQNLFRKREEERYNG